MTLSVLTQIQMQRFQASSDTSTVSRQRSSALLGERSNQIDEAYGVKKQAIDKQTEAREEAGFWTALLSVVLLPGIGTLLGKALGQATTGDEREEKAGLDLKAAVIALGQSKLEGELGEVKEALAEAKSDRTASQRFIDELDTMNSRKGD